MSNCRRIEAPVAVADAQQMAAKTIEGLLRVVIVMYSSSGRSRTRWVLEKTQLVVLRSGSRNVRRLDCRRRLRATVGIVVALWMSAPQA